MTIEPLIAFLMIACFIMGYLASPPGGPDDDGGDDGGPDDPVPWPEMDRLIDEWKRGERTAGPGA
jgi:hypothetical protein